jgi:hypothetical protein
MKTRKTQGKKNQNGSHAFFHRRRKTISFSALRQIYNRIFIVVFISILCCLSLATRKRRRTMKKKSMSILAERYLALLRIPILSFSRLFFFVMVNFTFLSFVHHVERTHVCSRQASLLLLLGATVFFFQSSGSQSNGSEITFQDFKTTLLESGKVAKLKVSEIDIFAFHMSALLHIACVA